MVWGEGEGGEGCWNGRIFFFLDDDRDLGLILKSVVQVLRGKNLLGLLLRCVFFTSQRERYYCM